MAKKRASRRPYLLKFRDGRQLHIDEARLSTLRSAGLVEQLRPDEFEVIASVAISPSHFARHTLLARVLREYPFKRANGSEIRPSGI